MESTETPSTTFTEEELNQLEADAELDTGISLLQAHAEIRRKEQVLAQAHEYEIHSKLAAIQHVRDRYDYPSTDLDTMVRNASLSTVSCQSVYDAHHYEEQLRMARYQKEMEAYQVAKAEYEAKQYEAEMVEYRRQMEVYHQKLAIQSQTIQSQTIQSQTIQSQTEKKQAENRQSVIQQLQEKHRQEQEEYERKLAVYHAERAVYEEQLRNKK